MNASFESTSRHSGTGPFTPGALVVATLGNPREKLWGAILSLTPEGLALAGVELASFEDLLASVREGESFSPGVLFFPMHRVERLELDLPNGNLPSLAQRFATTTGQEAAKTLTAGVLPTSAERERA
jgi:hypothetical protein